MEEKVSLDILPGNVWHLFVTTQIRINMYVNVQFGMMLSMEQQGDKVPSFKFDPDEVSAAPASSTFFLGEKIRLGTCFYRCERTGARRETLSVLIERIGLTRRHRWIESILEWSRLKCRKWVWISRGREKGICCCLRGRSCKRKDVIGEWRLLGLLMLRLLCLLMLRLLKVRIHGCILTVRWCLLREEIGNAKTIAAGCGCCRLMIRWWRGILVLDSRSMSARTSKASTERTLLNWARAFASSSSTFWGSSLSLKMRSREKLFKSCSVCCLRKREVSVEMAISW